MAWTRTFHFSRLFRRKLFRFDGHDLIPIRPVLVLDHQSQRRSERQAVTHSAENLDPILLDLHARAAAISLLTAPQFMIDLIDVDGQTCGQTFDDRDERATV